ncbi:hypothetical protein TNCV_4627971 [Trichonephila clavipes]|nr:hypothetical protein TNCV_4627971 [Trichonephila clavipes]
MTGGLPPLVGLHGGWRRTGMNTKKILMEPHSKSPSVEHKFEFHDGRNLCCQRKQVDTTSENTVLAPLMVTKPSLVPSTTIPLLTGLSNQPCY